MPAQSSQKGNKSKEFIDEFTKEILKVKKKKHDDRINKQKEDQRVKRAVEVGKLKQKFDSYGETAQKAPEKLELAVQAPAVQPVQNVPQPQTAPMIIQKPSSNPQPQKKPEPRIKPQNLPVTTIQIPPRLPELYPGEINFGKILFLVRDPLVTYIECPGEKKNLIIKRAGSTAKTQITLVDEEIKEIIKSFSEKARIPLVEGTLNARVANLEISAIVSESMPPSFILKRIVVDLSPKQTTSLARPMMQFPQPGQQPRAMPAMPPITRPFGPGQMPPTAQNPPNPIQQPPQRPPQQPLNQQQAPQNTENKESFLSKKITIGK
jgi:hypothetical protein